MSDKLAREITQSIGTPGYQRDSVTSERETAGDGRAEAWAGADQQQVTAVHRADALRVAGRCTCHRAPRSIELALTLHHDTRAGRGREPLGS